MSKYQSVIQTYQTFIDHISLYGSTLFKVEKEEKLNSSEGGTKNNTEKTRYRF